MDAPWLLTMQWHDICFMHWRAEVTVLERALPAGVELDRFQGDAWLSVVPFRMTDVRVRATPVFAGFGSVPEINLRTYVRVGDVPGVWFFSLDAQSPIAVRSARLMTALPYFDASIVARERNGTIDYASRRTARGVVPGAFRSTYTPCLDTREASVGSLDAFLHERYRFFSQRGSRLLSAQLHHVPWTLHSVLADIEENTLGDLIDYPLLRTPDLVTFARTLQVRASATRAIA
jgi:uncharacterized protein YqjF (DUF2071 family)